MIYPSVSDLVEKTGSRYALVIATAKRAREIAEGDDVLVECDSKKPVTIALNEIHSGAVEVVKKKKVVEEAPVEITEILDDVVID